MAGEKVEKIMDADAVSGTLQLIIQLSFVVRAEDEEIMVIDFVTCLKV